ncbi:protein of unknown function [Hyphomicrobium sp. 1Nfss2.1]
MRPQYWPRRRVPPQAGFPPQRAWIVLLEPVFRRGKRPIPKRREPQSPAKARRASKQPS